MNNQILNIANAIQEEAQNELNVALQGIKEKYPFIYAWVTVSVNQIPTELMPENSVLVKDGNALYVNHLRFSTIDNIQGAIKNVQLFSEQIKPEWNKSIEKDV